VAGGESIPRQQTADDAAARVATRPHQRQPVIRRSSIVCVCVCKCVCRGRWYMEARVTE